MSFTGIPDRCQDVLPLEEGIILQDLFIRCSRRQQIQDIADADAMSPDARLPAAFVGFDRYKIEKFIALNFISEAINEWRFMVAIACVARETSGWT